MDIMSPEFDCGIVVGRFQVPELHQAHQDLIETVISRHSRTIIVLGLSPLLATAKNPLDFESRKSMILESYPDVTVMYIRDTSSDEVWSQNLDRLVGDLVPATQSAVLYGSRDSFLSAYTGKYPTLELTSQSYVSGTEIRKAVSKRAKASEDFRIGCVYAATNRFPTSYTTVDVLIGDPDEDRNRILLGRKADETGYRLIGGFVDPSDRSFEDAAAREVMEEAGVVCDDTDQTMLYVGSRMVDDWRYRGEVDSIKTMLFFTSVWDGTPNPGDDIVELRWFDVPAYLIDIEESIVPEHFMLLELARDKGYI